MGRKRVREESVVENYTGNDENEGGKNKLNFYHLVEQFPQLEVHVRFPTTVNVPSTRHLTPVFNFSDSTALRILARALLAVKYKITWNLPATYLIPTVPGREEYIDLIASELLGGDLGHGLSVKGPWISGLDIGIGANAVYSIIGVCRYGWSMTGTDVSEESIEIARENLSKALSNGAAPDIRLQTNSQSIFETVVQPADRFTFTICNPPFYCTSDEANRCPYRSLDGQPHEVATPGGELQFLSRMVVESGPFGDQIMWFTTLVARAKHVKILKRHAFERGAVQVRDFCIGKGYLRRWVVAWSFQQKEERAGILKFSKYCAKGSKLL